jgi:uncharacterized protein (DUF608 family)
MKRRSFIKSSVASLAAASGGVLPAIAATASEKAIDDERVFGQKNGQRTLFPLNVPSRKWVQFEAAGYAAPACGLVYRRADEVPHGMPLGGVATASIDFDTDGTFGFCTLFNSGVPTRGPLGYSFLGLSSAGRTWILSTQAMAGVENPKEIHYWGHYPVADVEYELEAPLSVGVRAWNPFIPGDTRISNTPAAVFEVHVRNLGPEPRKTTLGFSFPGPTQAEAQISPTSPRRVRYIGFPVNEPFAEGVIPARREQIRSDAVNCLTVSAATGTEYSIGVIGSERVRFGGGLTIDGYDYMSGQHWMEIPTHLPRSAPEDFDSSLAVDVELGPHEEKIVRIVLAWFSPLWKGERTNVFTRMYARDYEDSLTVAQAIAGQHQPLLKRVIAWQSVVYGEQSLPVSLREALVNVLHLITKTGYWAVAKPPIGEWCRAEDGLFGMSECPRECPQIECIPCSFYGNIPLVYFFPDLARSTLRGYKAYQYPDGGPPWIFGGITGAVPDGGRATDPCDMATPSPGYQSTMNGPCYIDMFDRYWQRTGDHSILEEFYPSLKKAVFYTIKLRPGAEGIVSVPAGDRNPTQAHTKPGTLLEWFEGNGWFGMTPHVGGVHLAMLRMAERMAETMKDSEFAAQCRHWIEQGSHAMESKLWTGNYYLSYYEPELGKKSDLIFAYQLDGEWMTSYHGLPGVFQADRVPVALNRIKDTCVAIVRYGAANFTQADGKPAEGVGYGTYGYFVPELYMLASTYIYNGQRDTGLRILESCLEGLSVKHGDTWNQPNTVSGDTGLRMYGSDYYQNLILWSLPAALAGQDFRAACAAGTLVTRIIEAGKAVQV